MKQGRSESVRVVTAECYEMDNYDMRSFQTPLLKRQYYDNNTEGDRLVGTVACVEEIKKAGSVHKT